MSAFRNPNLGPSHIRQRRRRLFFIRFSIVVFFLAVIVITLAILSGHEKVKIQTISISGNSFVSKDKILDIVSANLTGRYFYLFSKSNSLIFPRFQIKRDLLAQIKAIKGLDISWENWKEISIVVDERKPHSVWCGNDIKAENPICYLMDKNGYIYSQAPTFSGSIYVKSFGQLAPNQLNNISFIDPIGSYFLPTGQYLQLFDLIKILDQNNLKVVFLWHEGSDFKFYLENGLVIIFNDKKSFNDSFQNFFTAIGTKSLDLQKDISTISYVDLRFDNKIVVGKK